MESYKQEFIEFMVESNVLKFGDFTLKSGRKSPFFMNAGAYVTARSVRLSRESEMPTVVIAAGLSRSLSTRSMVSASGWSRSMPGRYILRVLPWAEASMMLPAHRLIRIVVM